VRLSANPVEFVRDRLPMPCTPLGWFSRACGLFADSLRVRHLGLGRVVVQLALAVDRLALGRLASPCLASDGRVIPCRPTMEFKTNAVEVAKVVNRGEQCVPVPVGCPRTVRYSFYWLQYSGGPRVR
jgi:hypothetical protein